MTFVTDGEALGVAIDAERVAARLSRSELAELVGVSEESLGRYIRGETEPKLAILRQLASALDQRPQDLLTRADQILSRSTRMAGMEVAGDRNIQVGGDIGSGGASSAEAQSVNVAGATVFGDVKVIMPEDDDTANDSDDEEYGRASK